MPGFVPVNFKKAGRVLLIIGLICLIIKAISYLTGWFFAANYIFYLGIGFILISFYLIFILPEE